MLKANLETFYSLGFQVFNAKTENFAQSGVNI